MKVIMSHAFEYLYTQIGLRKCWFLHTRTCTYSYTQHIIISSFLYVFLSCFVLVCLHLGGQSLCETQNNRKQRYTHNTHGKYDGRKGNGRPPPKVHGSCHCHEDALRLLLLRFPLGATRNPLPWSRGTRTGRYFFMTCFFKKNLSSRIRRVRPRMD